MSEEYLSKAKSKFYSLPTNLFFDTSGVVIAKLRRVFFGIPSPPGPTHDVVFPRYGPQTS